ncbi:hypothetical protein M514_09435 [Trichuris suis]|uniref:Uncharacterized protein n=1 Tax=Trichuris suis TaxID=68888 RepID=A0A085MTE1_9BILA|nr:hypothetical protein M513_09435 [Trichuris suis]KFD60487.1 hypothetical protein M514_09435 [Trichuris suis]
MMHEVVIPDAEVAKELHSIVFHGSHQRAEQMYNEALYNTKHGNVSTYSSARASCVHLANRASFEEVEYQDVDDILNWRRDELTIEQLQELSVEVEEKEDRKQMMMKIRKLLRDS